MIFAAILAGGAGKRMQNEHGNMPKQFLPLGGKSVVAHTIEHFRLNPRVDSIYVAVPQAWESYAAEQLLGVGVGAGVGVGVGDGDGGAGAGDGDGDGGASAGSGVAGSAGITIIKGGSDRTSSLLAVVNKIETQYGINCGDIIITHDAVRPFVTQRIIDENIEMCKIYGAVATVYTLTDTPIISKNADIILEIPDRSNYYAAQTPQTFDISLLKEVICSLSDGEKSQFTDAAKMFLLKNKSVKIVMGESYNIKITTPFDYMAARAFVGRFNDAELTI